MLTAAGWAQDKKREPARFPPEKPTLSLCLISKTKIGRLVHYRARWLPKRAVVAAKIPNGLLTKFLRARALSLLTIKSFIAFRYFFARLAELLPKPARVVPDGNQQQ